MVEVTQKHIDLVGEPSINYVVPTEELIFYLF